MQLPSPTELLSDGGPIGVCLRSLPRWTLAASGIHQDPWLWLAQRVTRYPIEYQYEGPATDFAAEVARYEAAGFKRGRAGVWIASKAARTTTGIREVRFHQHTVDASKRVKRVIMDAPWPAAVCKTLRAAVSQRRAVIRLAEAAAGGGSISKSYHAELLKALKEKNRRAATHWAHKVAAAIFRTDHGRRWLMQYKSTPKNIRSYARSLYRQFLSRDSRMIGRRKAEIKWRGEIDVDFKQETASDKIAVQLVMGWLTLPNGFPGYCFISDDIIPTLLGLFIPSLKSANWKLVLTIRERIGLKKGALVVTRLKKRKNGDWVARDSRGVIWGMLKQKGKAVP